MSLQKSLFPAHPPAIVSPLQHQQRPLASSSNKKKLASTFRHRSPSAHSSSSPSASKARKASADQQTNSGLNPKDKKTWKGKVAKQLKKIHPGSSSSGSASHQTGGAIGEREPDQRF